MIANGSLASLATTGPFIANMHLCVLITGALSTNLAKEEGL